MGYPQYAAQVMGTCIKWYARQGKFDKAKAAMDDYETLSGYFQDNGEVKPGMEDYYHIKGTYYLEKGYLDSAEFFFQKLQAKGKTTNDRYLASWGLSQLYTKTGESDSVAKYAFLNSVQNDSIYNERTAQNLLNAQAMYNYARHQENALRKELETKDIEINRRNWIIAGALLLSIIVFFWRKQIRLKKSELRTANRKNTQLSTQLHTANEENAQLNTQLDANNLKIAQLNEQILEKARIMNGLQEQVEDKSRLIKQLNEIINHNAANLETIAQMEQTVAIQLQQMEDLQLMIDNFTQSRAINEIRQHPAIARMAELSRLNNKLPHSHEWHALYDVVETHFPKFTNLRQMETISESEYQVCVLTKLQFALHEIASLTNSTKARLGMIRKRLLEKIFNTTEGGAKMFDHCMREY
jgi:DNA repair exonuclease SbcCD ATPase subunit